VDSRPGARAHRLPDGGRLRWRDGRTLKELLGLDLETTVTFPTVGLFSAVWDFDTVVLNA
jgi:hypothetical protein